VTAVGRSDGCFAELYSRGNNNFFDGAERKICVSLDELRHRSRSEVVAREVADSSP